MFLIYIEQYPVRWTAQSALNFTPPPHLAAYSFRHQLDFPGTHSSHAAITCEDYLFTFVRPPGTQLNELGHRGEKENIKLRYSSKGDSNPGSLDCESGILPLSYRTPHQVPRSKITNDGTWQNRVSWLDWLKYECIILWRGEVIIKYGLWINFFIYYVYLWGFLKKRFMSRFITRNWG